MKELMLIQSELKAPKAQLNKFGGYKYRSCEDILKAVKPLLLKHGCTLAITDEVRMVGERYYVVATAAIVNAGGESIQTTAYAREEADKKGMDAAQITGSASSYARKYALNGLFCLDDTRDADALNTHGQTASTAQQSQAPAQPTQDILDLAAMVKIDIEIAPDAETVKRIWVERGSAFRPYPQLYAEIKARVIEKGKSLKL